MTLSIAFDSFMAESFESAVDSSTEAAYGGSGYSVELFEDGSYRVLWNNQIGNLYDSEGLIIGIPPLSESDDDIDNGRFYDNAEQEMKDKFTQEYEDLQKSKLELAKD